MAGADASIYSLIRPVQQGPGPLQQYGQAMQLRSLIDDQGLKQLQRQQLERGIADDDALRQVEQESMGDPTKIRQGMSQRGLYRQRMDFDKNQAAAGKAEAEAMKIDRENFVALADNARKRMAAVRDPQAWQMFRDEQIQMAGMFKTPAIRETALRMAQAMPAEFNPNYIRDSLVKAEELFTPKIEMKDLGGKVVPVDTNPFTNPAILRQDFTKTMTPDARANAVTVPDAAGVYQPNRPVIQAKAQIAAAGRPNVTTNILPPQKTFENEDKLRGDYTANPMVKSSSEMQNAFGMIEAAYKRPSAANDLAMATKYMKILDPTSVVRESEFALAVNATGLLDKVQNYAASVIEGKKLNPAQRRDFYESAKAINDAFQAERQKVDEQYSEMATGYGLNPKNVIPSLRSPKPDAGKPKPQARKTIGGKNYVQIDGNWFEE